MSAYPLENSERERARLVRQAQLVRPFTERLLRNAGAREGAAVLDLGAGAGDVALLAAEVVGHKGRVVSIDLNPDNVVAATKRAANEGVANVTFIEGDIGAPPTDAPFDVAIGRYVLMYHPDPVAAVRGIARALKPGGTVGFHELNLFEGSRGDTWPEIPAAFFATMQKLNLGMVKRTQNHLAPRLPGIFAEAGLDISEWGFEGIAPILKRDDAMIQMLGLWRAFAGPAIDAGLLRDEDIDRDGLERWFMSLPEHAALALPLGVLGWARKKAA